MVCGSTYDGISVRWLKPDSRLHLQHGPIDLIIDIDGDASECALAFEQVIAAFGTVLETLVSELTMLRTTVSSWPAATCADTPGACSRSHGSINHGSVESLFDSSSRASTRTGFTRTGSKKPVTSNPVSINTAPDSMSPDGDCSVTDSTSRETNDAVLPLAKGPVARRMIAAVKPFSTQYITPMAAVAGAVADHILQSACHQRTLRRVLINNGGDIAIYLSPGQSAKFGLVDDVRNPVHSNVVTLSHTDKVGGLATSGWQGRSFSLGVADAVTVLAKSAAMADAAATMIANAVNIDQPDKIQRCAACELDEDSDLGQLPVTLAVSAFTATETQQALSAGKSAAIKLINSNRILGARLALQGHSMVIPNHFELLSNTRYAV